MRRKGSITVLFLGILLSCSPRNNAAKNDQQNKNDQLFSGKIIRDCTGVYLDVDGKDYQICNADKVKGYKENTEIKVVYEITEKCKEFDGKAVCMMYHPKEALIRIKEIKK